ncbi:MAG: hypothetical protein A2655_03330 [Candidatus Yanofskybacteria bacterium RIFCSPHIGHO2_01_FULL_43_42]|uniref:DUF2784 domain-containing protein n=1 Tax=Candidatus Yanofskybacteria bacterium RIFCSPLOWO2_01_FULL_43_22 TaxID=1802695 RepID=A0A1F8GF22_9BACT|nr:MAG: hypothetical protein A2655_03330 [Candidatus Yanofskybacteria bacterium RIFCSPHIGHO2_01_FULL_43_42]OGN13029.1 MAG: hypothetical protein A3D48_03990 [Candidatus Yanofskybacteria bacterium RIFCSPHIGHO2_02_FULL_43_17]OGN23891.1 MAG: hypothetical protein A3A13_02270 [Candidatus Yanofskybacteria bacterium RIFCSPLOWO2_01_FULL_43_22]
MIRRLLFYFLSKLIFYLHFFALLVIHLGWLFPSYRLGYIIFLGLILVQHLILGYCILTPWEFYFRRKLNKNFNRSGANFTAINLKRFFGIVVTNRCVDISSTSFLVGMIVLQIVLLLN